MMVESHELSTVERTGHYFFKAFLECVEQTIKPDFTLFICFKPESSKRPSTGFQLTKTCAINLSIK